MALQLDSQIVQVLAANGGYDLQTRKLATSTASSASDLAANAMALSPGVLVTWGVVVNDAAMPAAITTVEMYVNGVSVSTISIPALTGQATMITATLNVQIVNPSLVEWYVTPGDVSTATLGVAAFVKWAV